VNLEVKMNREDAVLRYNGTFYFISTAVEVIITVGSLTIEKYSLDENDSVS
jgi:hypothetical protein